MADGRAVVQLPATPDTLPGIWAEGARQLHVHEYDVGVVVIDVDSWDCELAELIAATSAELPGLR